MNYFLKLTILAFVALSTSFVEAEQNLILHLSKPVVERNNTHEQLIIRGRAVNDKGIGEIIISSAGKTISTPTWILDEQTEKRPLCSWVFVLDVSDKKNRKSVIEQQKKDTLSILASLPENDLVSIYGLETGHASIAHNLPPEQAGDLLKNNKFKQKDINLGKTYIYKNLNHLLTVFSQQNDSTKNKAFVIFTDGKDESPGIIGGLRKDEFLKGVEKDNIACHFISYVRNDKELPFTHELKHIATKTGGNFFPFYLSKKETLSLENKTVLVEGMHSSGKLVFTLGIIPSDTPFQITIKGMSGKKTWNKEYEKMEFSQEKKPVLTDLKNLEIKISDIVLKLESINEITVNNTISENPKEEITRLTLEKNKQAEELAELAKHFSELNDSEYKAQISSRLENLNDASPIEKSINSCALHLIETARQDKTILTKNFVMEQIEAMVTALRHDEEMRLQALPVISEEQDTLMANDDDNRNSLYWVIGGVLGLISLGTLLIIKLASLKNMPHAMLAINDYRNTPYTIKSPVTRIGKSPDNDCVINNDSISRNHCEIRYSQGQWTIADLHSSNGVYVNTRKIVETVIQSGDLIELGEVTITFNSK